jgi:hypothetical protein
MEELNNIKIDTLKPYKLIDKSKLNEIDNFFLTLGLIYNDLKGLVIFYRLSEEKYLVKEEEGLTFRNGELGGLKLQIYRLMIGLIRETIKFIYLKQSTIKSPKFKLIESKIHKNDLVPWYEICLVSFSEFSKDDNSFLSKIKKVRDDVSFHYDDKEVLRNWFIEKFYNEEKNETNKNCCYVNNFQMRSSRFFYCDAIIQKYLLDQLVLDKEGDYLKEMVEFIGKLNISIIFLMNSYVDTKKNR